MHADHMLKRHYETLLRFIHVYVSACGNFVAHAVLALFLLDQHACILLIGFKTMHAIWKFHTTSNHPRRCVWGHPKPCLILGTEVDYEEHECFKSHIYTLQICNWLIHQMKHFQTILLGIIWCPNSQFSWLSKPKTGLTFWCEKYVVCSSNQFLI